MDPNRSAWNKQQLLLIKALAKPEAHPDFLSLFLYQHAQVHSKKMFKLIISSTPRSSK